MMERRVVKMEVYDSCGQRFSFSSWDDFLGNWEEYGDEFVRLAVKHPGFMDWLKDVRPARAELVEKVLGNDVYLTGAFLAMDDGRVQKGHPALKRLAELVEQSAADPTQNIPEILKCLEGEAHSLLPTEGLSEEISSWQTRLKNETQKEPRPGEEMTVMLPGGVPMTFCWCPATTSEAWKKISGGDDFFWMGSPESEADRRDGEARHRVRLTRGFWMGKYPVMQRQWEGVMGETPSYFKGEDRPVESVSWNACQAFVERINAAGRVRVSLPTEAQWEHACRAGTTTPYSFGSALNGDRANCNGNYPYGTTAMGRYRRATSPVGEYAPNAWGLHDMHGNVWEWCRDWYGSYAGDVTDPTGPASGSDRVMRGGGWYDDAQNCRSAYRYSHSPSDNYHITYGFRLCCSAGPRR